MQKSSITKLKLAYIASVSVEQRVKNVGFSGFCPREKWGESTNKKEGMVEGKETLADKPLDFENPRSPAKGDRDWLGWSNIIDICR